MFNSLLSKNKKPIKVKVGLRIVLEIKTSIFGLFKSLLVKILKPRKVRVGFKKAPVARSLLLLINASTLAYSLLI